MKKILYIVFLSSFILPNRGDLISYEFVDSMDSASIQNDLNNSFGSLSPEAIYDINLYSVVYETIDQFGNYTEASGLISYPENINNAFPLLSFQHGTQIRRNSAPSMNGFNDLVKWLTTNGYIYIEPDYLGLGVSQLFHPYHLKDVTASSVIDMILATRDFIDITQDIQFNNQLFLAGYSEGGYATMATVKEVEENEYPELNITVSFPMAGAYDLSGVMVDLMLSELPYADPFYLPYFVLSYIEKYDLGLIEDFFLSEYATIFPDLFSGEYSGGYINSFLPDIPIHMMKPSVVEEFTLNQNYPFRLTLQENDLYDWSPQNLMYLFHGIADERVPYENSVVAYNKFIENGSQNVYFESLGEEVGGHQDAAVYCLLGAFSISESLKKINNLGDVNADSFINIQDVISLLIVIFEDSNGLFELADLYSYIYWASDINIDQSINIFDVINLVNIILNDE